MINDNDALKTMFLISLDAIKQRTENVGAVLRQDDCGKGRTRLLKRGRARRACIGIDAADGL
ncbi:hypothetical protein ACFQY5_40885 [Paeniroseomonas aquatica]|uniref:hypothetical protein n=1 Tax=Paeniroseomonas aquatica TaxID=373043 RepID=UPI003618A033